MPISPARVAAFQVLLRVETQSAYAAELLHSENISRLSAQDRNLAMQVVMGVLRWQSRLDDELRQFVSGKNDVAKLDAEVRISLRMAVFQLRSLDRVPMSAVVNDSVDLVKRAGKTSAASLVNAVLRKVKPAHFEVPVEMSSAAAIADAFAHPLWMVERWVTKFGMEKTRAVCEANQQQPQTALRFPIEPAEIKQLDKELAGAGVMIIPGALLTSARRVVSGDVTAMAASRERRVAVQDEASQLVAALVGKGEHILDCCAAPGGKTQVIAERNPQAQIVAAELHPQRARMMREMVTAKNVEVVAQDVTTLKAGQMFDRVLADVPCSGTGTLARNPEIKWRLKLDDLADLHRRQVSILNAAIDRSAAGARVVYSTCSLEKEEDEDVVAEVMHSRTDMRLIPVNEILNEMKSEIAWKDLHSLISGEGFLRTLPGVHPCDGFFAAVMAKVSA